jgi:hypothetical protein
VFPNAILRNGKITIGARMTYGMLLSYGWQKDFCFPAQEQLAKDLGISDRSVRTHLSELRELGLVSWKQQGLNRPNIYFIHAFPSLEEETAESKPMEISGPENFPVRTGSTFPVKTGSRLPTKNTQRRKQITLTLCL